MTIKAYPRGSGDYISPHFRASEFDCKCGKCKTTYFDVDLVRYVLVPTRSLLNVPGHVNSGYRCAEHNKKVGGSYSSLHTGKGAVDITFETDDHKKVAATFEKLGAGGIGWYPDQSFVHVDGREKKFFWRGHEQHQMQSFIDPEVKPDEKMIDAIATLATKNYNALMKLLNEYR